MNIFIREAVSQDSAQITELEKQFGLTMDIFENGEKGYTNGYYDDDSYLKDEYYSDEKHPLYIADLNGKIIGFISLMFEEDYLEYGDSTCIIVQVYVNPVYRKEGAGKLLVEKAEEISKEKACDQITATVMPKNESAANFFVGLGYELESSRFVKKTRLKKYS